MYPEESIIDSREFDVEGDGIREKCIIYKDTISDTQP